MASITKQLAEAVGRISYRDLPQPVVHKTKQVLLDSIGCAIAGHIVDRGRIALELVEEVGGKPGATILGQGRTSWPLAAYANGELMNALDFDAMGPMIGHVVPFVLPPALAMAERAGASGEELLAASALALEVGGRTASSLPGHRLPATAGPDGRLVQETNPRFTYTVTVFGGVAGAAKAMRMAPDKLAHALGIAGINVGAATAHKWEYTGGPAPMTKYGTNSGFVAQLAATSAALAEKGFTADNEILDGEWSLQKVFGVAFYKPEKIVEGLGETWHLDLVAIKGFPCCGADHAFIVAVNKILAENRIRPEDIDEIVARGDGFYLTPNRAQESILSYADAQFAHSFLVGVAPYHGEKPSPAWLSAETYQDPRVLAMMRKVRMEAHPAPSELLSGATRQGGWSPPRDAQVEIRSKGRVYSAEVSSVRGSGANPFSDEELRAKFMTNASYSRLSEARAKEAADMIYRLEEMSDISGLMDALRVE